MAEANTAEVEAKVDAAFGAGFGNTPPAPAAKVVEEASVEPVTPAAEPDKAAVVVAPEKPKYVRVTEQEWNNAKAMTGKVPALESQLAKLTGNAPDAGKIAQQVLETLKSQTPAGLNVEISDEDFAELVEEFPEIGKGTKAALERIFKKANVKGTAPAPAQSPAQPVDMNAAVEQVLMKREYDTLTKTYPDWSEIVGRPVNGTDPEATPYRQWLGKQSAEYQKAVNETQSPAEVQESIRHFRESQSAAATPGKPDKAAARRATLEDAVTPRAEGNPPPLNSPQTAEEAFSSAFKAAKRH